MDRHLNINGYVDWLKVLPAIGMELSAAALPFRSSCPLCGVCHQFTVYSDHVYAGQWFHCRSCKESGDTIELAAKVWKIDVEAAARRLMSYGLIALAREDFEAVLPKYMLRYVNYRIRISQFWEKCRMSIMPFESSDYRVLLDYAGLHYDNNIDLWRRRAGRFIGASTKDEVDVSLWRNPDHVDPTRSHREKKYWTFRGNGWDSVMVIPAWDLPGRIRSFVFVGRESRIDDIAVYTVCHDNRLRPDTGLVMLPEATADATEFNGSVIVVDDVLAAVRTQARHLRDNDNPLPIVSTVTSNDESKSTSNWDLLASKNKVFWGSSCSNVMISRARETNGRIRVDPGVENAVTYLSRHLPRVWVERTIRQSIEWTEALESKLEKMSPADGEVAVLELNLSVDERAKISSQHKKFPVSVARINSSFNRLGLTVIIDGSKFTENFNGWHRDGELICGARMRIDQVIVSNRPDGTRASHYDGSLSIGNDSLEFCELAYEVDRNGFEWIRQRLMENRKGIVQYKRVVGYSPSKIAMAFHRPDIVEGSSRCGWNRQEHGFAFFRTMVKRNGFSRALGYHYRDAETPTLVCQHDELTGADWADLTRRNGTCKLFWAISAAVLSCVMAPVYCLRPFSVLVCGRSASAGMRMAENLGCLSYSTPARKDGTISLIERMRIAENAHDWPVVFNDRDTLIEKMQRLRIADDSSSNSVSRIGYGEAKAAKTHERCVVIDADDSVDSTSVRDPSYRVASSFLRWMLTKNMVLSKEGTLPSKMLAAITEWANSHDVDTKSIVDAAELFDVFQTPK